MFCDKVDFEFTSERRPTGMRDSRVDAALLQEFYRLGKLAYLVDCVLSEGDDATVRTLKELACYLSELHWDDAKDSFVRTFDQANEPLDDVLSAMASFRTATSTRRAPKGAGK